MSYFNRLSLTTFTLLVAMTSSVIVADTRVIYGEDDRHEVKESLNSVYKRQAKSVATVVRKYQIEESIEGLWRIQGEEFGDLHNLCPEERFYEQLVIGNCSGFLIADDLLLTAGHCVPGNWSCRQSAFVFGYESTDKASSSGVLEFPKDDVYFCEEVVKMKNLSEFSVDFALLKLDRKVKDREPLTLRSKFGRVYKGLDVYAIGYPAGLPVKIMKNAVVLESKKNAYFTADIDSMVGFSGSPVFNTYSHDVEGMLISGEKDFVLTQDGCYVSNKCDVSRDKKCNGEIIQRISEIKPYIPDSYESIEP